ncbi:ketopantoate reductase family protein [Protaetiibacter mangrovi]|uniref:2-dehydropantoate 2-reductase n=1 Tax=Protaetiibacter mangrovi TaxID=2970926 RepID=A0ABT1ZBA9_9MICO|nr:2-dehydropantoate 2-reductase [Protaetiibacter mangrovi]MCS0497984.1 2-dehydropantoate 2-reductase [Protaetiibacter mangrovi]TPX04748.1 2-dehydropantoate 2-reductase [Schumannella luteola]
MRIGVIGAGAVGGTFAGLLAAKGHEVEVTARGAQLDALRAGGLLLDGGWGEHRAAITAHATLTERPELAILATKAQDSATALAANATRLEGVPILVVQNGLGGLEVAHRELPDAPLLGALALFAASYLEPGHVTVTGPNPVVIGAGPGADRVLLERIAGVVGEAMPVEVSDDITAAQWTKLLINHVNALPAITGLSVQEVVVDRGLRRVMTASMRETVRLARRMGVRFGKVQGVSGSVLNLLAVLPLGIGEQFPRLLARRMGAVPNPGSTLQSIRRGQLTEIDFLNGAVVRAAADHALLAPVNAAIVALVHEVERTGSFLSPAEVVDRVPV